LLGQVDNSHHYGTPCFLDPLILFELQSIVLVGLLNEKGSEIGKQFFFLIFFLDDTVVK